MLKVLIVEDDPVFRKGWEGKLRNKVEVVSAHDRLGVRRALTEHKGNLAAIVMCTSLERRTLDTADLVGEIRGKGFAGPIIATSVVPSYNEAMLKAGCTHSVLIKGELPDALLKIMGLTPGN